MRFSAAACAAALFSPTALGLNILLNNDDGFASAQLRETYRLLKKAGHNAVIVAPVDNESGQGGRTVFTTSPTLTIPSEFGLIPAGAPSIGRDPTDSGVWYYNGTPAACTFVGLDYVIPKFYPHMMPIDLLVAGPNFGLNLGPFLYTLSGTIGATYAAVGRGIPGVAFSGGNTEQRSYKEINQTTPTGLKDPATIQAELAVDVVKALVAGKKKGERILPLGYGVSVNSPYITSLTNKSCVNPIFKNTRMTGGAITDLAVYNSSTKLFTYGNSLAKGVNKDINGDFKLAGETDVVDGGCRTSMTVFTVDYDAPTGNEQLRIRQALDKIRNKRVTKRVDEPEDRELSVREKEARHPLRHE